jgi:hypothetical protein
MHEVGGQCPQVRPCPLYTTTLAVARLGDNLYPQLVSKTTMDSQRQSKVTIRHYSRPTTNGKTPLQSRSTVHSHRQSRPTIINQMQDASPVTIHGPQSPPVTAHDNQPDARRRSSHDPRSTIHDPRSTITSHDPQSPTDVAAHNPRHTTALRQPLWNNNKPQARLGETHARKRSNHRRIPLCC